MKSKNTVTDVDIEISKDLIANIKEYEKSIKTYESFVGVVRQTPARFIGGRGNQGFLNMLREIIQNAIDQAMREDSPCNHIKISFDDRSLMSIVEDNGLGIPFGLIIKIFTDDKTSGNYVKKKGQFSAGTHGTGYNCSPII